jgi:hypothetical protein
VVGALWQTRPALVVVATVLFTLIAVAALRWLRPRLPPPDHPPALAADSPLERFSEEQVRQAIRTWSFRVFDRDLLEKAVLVGLITVIFSQIIPGAETRALPIAIGVAIVTIVNTVLSHWLARRGYGLPDTILEFVLIAAVNLFVILTYDSLSAGRDDLASSLFFVLLLTLIITLFDRFQVIHLVRFPRKGEVEEPVLQGVKE